MIVQACINNHAVACLYSKYVATNNSIYARISGWCWIIHINADVYMYVHCSYLHAVGLYSNTVQYWSLYTIVAYTGAASWTLCTGQPLRCAPNMWNYCHPVCSNQECVDCFLQGYARIWPQADQATWRVIESILISGSLQVHYTMNSSVLRVIHSIQELSWPMLTYAMCR